MPRRSSPDDAEQEAYIGLCRAADSYDESRGEFLALCHPGNPDLPRGRGPCVPVEPPTRLARAIRKVQAARARLMAEGDRNPTPERIAEITTLPLGLIREALASMAPRPRLESLGILDPMPTEKLEGMAEQLWDAVSLCDQLERAVVILAFGLDGDPAQDVPAISNLLAITPQKVTGLLRSAKVTIGRQLAARGWTAETWHQQAIA